LNRLEKLLEKKPETKKEVKDRTDEIIKAIKGIKLEVKDIEFPESISIDNFPPQKVPQPATNISINPLRGEVHSTSVTVGTTATPLPAEPLENRRALIFYNNGSKTIYLGGSDVTKDNGLPILTESFSPAFDSGPLQIWYGVTASGETEIRIVELANTSGR